MTRAARWLLTGAWCGLMAACGQDFEPPDRSVRVEAAAERYRAEIFDTIGWNDEGERQTLGNEVYAARCRRCHGAFGRGVTDYTRARGLSVPSIVEPGWPLADVDSLRRRIYVGHESGMPIFGEGSLTAREIDATAGYILVTLRPDIAERW